MSSSSRRRSPKPPRKNLVPPALLLLVPLLLGSASQPAVRPHPAVPFVAKSDRTALLFAEAAEAARRNDCGGASKALAPLAAGKGPEAGFARLVTGFYAHSCQQAGQAEERLFAAQDPDGILEDWRLYTLSDAAEARGHILLAQASLAKLLGDYPASPLRPRALAEAAELAWKQGDARRALDLVAQARREKVSGPEATRLEKLAWEIGTAISSTGGDEEVRREAARRLLADSPSAAAELAVAEIFRDEPEGNGNNAAELAWAAILTPDQLERRARSLLDLKLDASALAVLDAADARDRDLDWALLKAEALTRINEGLGALELLSGRTTSSPKQLAALEWARAQAAAEVATARRGRTMPAAQRQQYLERSHGHLRKVGQMGAADPELAIKALRSLYKDLADDSFEESIEVLRQLRRLAARDTTGASHLWQRGWREYGRSNFSSAIGYWTELFALYPDDSAGRRGRYWSARSFEALGETERAQQIYREVASADTTDLYRKNALIRLRGKAPAVDERGVEVWPDDPTLHRARLLTDLGLEELAIAEMELVGLPGKATADERARKALEALVQSRNGERRKSMLTIREAFPALGGPHQATLPEAALRLYYPLDYQDTVRAWATQNRLPLHLVYGIIRQESAFDTQAQSWAGARGLMQLMPATARELAGKAGLSYSHDKLSDPAFNLRLGTTYFSQVLNMFDSNVELALAGYNGGPYRIKRMWKESRSKELDRFLEGLDLEESKTYVKRILVLSDSYRQLYPLPG
ncbi:MAG TPA: lytic transglycosylase domain-containing protein [Thermoanaerobaculia bacterium]|nr:lytic transglycosylase domain-containing protein [Thermoanaerobaculia bacterium]